jgi:hypothetical protein
MRFGVKMMIAVVTAFIFVASTQAAIPTGYKGKPFSGDTINGKPQQIPGIIKSVFFDEGGEDTAFHEAIMENESNLSMRKNKNTDWQVDMQPFQDTPRPDYNVDGSKELLGSWHLSWIVAGEWVKFTVHVNTAGMYYISLKVSMVDKENLSTISFNDGKPDSIKNIKAVVIPSKCIAECKQPQCEMCEIYHMWDIYDKVDSVTLDTGLFVMKYQFDKGAQNFDWIKFTAKNPTSVTPRPALQTNRALDVAASISGSRLHVAYKLPQPGAARLSVVDCAGRMILNSQIQDAVAGCRNESFNMPALNKGLYFARIEQDGESRTVVVLFLK